MNPLISIHLAHLVRLNFSNAIITKTSLKASSLGNISDYTTFHQLKTVYGWTLLVTLSLHPPSANIQLWNEMLKKTEKFSRLKENTYIRNLVQKPFLMALLKRYSTDDIFLRMFRLFLDKLFHKAPLNDVLGRVSILFSKHINRSLGKAG